MISRARGCQCISSDTTSEVQLADVSMQFHAAPSEWQTLTTQWLHGREVSTFFERYPDEKPQRLEFPDLDTLVRAGDGAWLRLYVVLDPVAAVASNGSEFL